MFADGPQRHFLDKGDIQPLLNSKIHQRRHLILIASPQDHAVQLDAAEAGMAGRLDPRQYLVQIAGAREGAEALRVQGIQADIEPIHPPRLQSLRVAG